MIESAIDFEVLCVGFDLFLMGQTASFMGQLRIKFIKTADEFQNFLEHYQLPKGSSVLLSTSTEGISTLEISQALRSYFEGTSIYFLTTDQKQFNIAELKKNGVNDCFLWPNDRLHFSQVIDEIKRRTGKLEKKRLKAVKLLDLEPGIDLPFEIKTYIPLNNRYLPITGSGTLSEKKCEILKKRHVNSVYIDEDESEKFYDFSAKRLAKLYENTEGKMSETERVERLQSTVRDLFQSVLDTSENKTDFQSGRDLLEQSQKVVQNYVQGKTGLNLKQQLVDTVGDGSDSYSHAQSVSSMACLLSMATGLGRPEDLAIAGLFHDIGLQGILSLISPFERFNPDDTELIEYWTHPKRSVSMLKEKKITVTPEIAEIIEHHHERADGEGFPEKVQSHRISPSAHLLAYADAFQFLLEPKAGKKTKSLAEIHNEICSRLSLSPEVTLRIGNLLATPAAA